MSRMRIMNYVLMESLKSVISAIANSLVERSLCG